MALKRFHTVGLLCIAAFAAAPGQSLFPELGGQKAGISSFQFLKIGVTSRAVAMGEAFVAVANDASSLYWNPAGAVQFQENELQFAHADWFADIRHQFGAYVHHFGRSDAVGISVIALHMDDIERTTVTQPFGTGEFFTYRDLAFGLTYARQMTDLFSFGVTVRYIDETLAEVKMRNIFLDLGAFYWTGFGSTRFAFVLSNFGRSAKPSGSVEVFGVGKVDQFEDFPAPTQLKIAFAFDPVNNEASKVTATVQLNHPTDNRENVALGGEYTWHDVLSVRGGYRLNVDSQGFPALGAGVQVPVSSTKVGFDYSFSDFEVLGNVHRFTVWVRY